MLTQKANFPPLSVLSLLNSSPNTRLTGASTRSNGILMLSCSNAVVYTYDIALGCFTKLADSWWAKGSEAWGLDRQRTLASNCGLSDEEDGFQEGLVAYVEGYCDRHMKPLVATTSTVDAKNSGNNNSSGNSKGEEKPQWWAEVLTLGHQEMLLYAAKTLESPFEFKQALYMYAKKIADEGFRWKAEELIKDLFGPIYWCVSTFSSFTFSKLVQFQYGDRRPGRDDGWVPRIAGCDKRTVLMDVLVIFGACLFVFIS